MFSDGLVPELPKLFHDIDGGERILIRDERGFWSNNPKFPISFGEVGMPISRLETCDASSIVELSKSGHLSVGANKQVLSHAILIDDHGLGHFVLESELLGGVPISMKAATIWIDRKNNQVVFVDLSKNIHKLDYA